MKLNAKSRYAITALTYVALAGTEPVTLTDIASDSKISLTFLEQIFNQLRRSEVVASTRGPGGGYTLTTSPKELSLKTILDAVGEGFEPTDPYCVSNVIEKSFNEYLDSVKLSDFLA